MLRLRIELGEGEVPESPIGRVPSGASMDFLVARAFGAASAWDIVFTSAQGEDEFEDRQTII
jgi:hypothetical protein